MKHQLPFGMQVLDTTTNHARGYGIYPTQWDYNAKKQVTNMALMGKSEPTTYSQVGSTGIFGSDSDQGSDDTGTD